MVSMYVTFNMFDDAGHSAALHLKCLPDARTHQRRCC